MQPVLHFSYKSHVEYKINWKCIFYVLNVHNKFTEDCVKIETPFMPIDETTVKVLCTHAL